MLVGYVISIVSDDPAFDGLGRCAPFVDGGGEYLKVARMWEKQCRFIAFGGGSLVFRRGGSVCSGGKKRRVIPSGCISKRGGEIFRHDDDI